MSRLWRKRCELTTVKEPVKTFTGVPKPIKTPTVVPQRAPAEEAAPERELVPVKREKESGGE